LIGWLSGDQRFGIRLPSIQQMLFWHQFPVRQGRVNIRKGGSIWDRPDRRVHWRNQAGKVFVTGLTEVYLIANPMRGTLRGRRCIPSVRRKVKLRRLQPILSSDPGASLVLG